MSISTPPNDTVATTPSISMRAAKVPASPIRKLADLAVDARKRGTKVYGLNVGQPDVPTPPVFFETLRTFSEKVVAYGHSKGRQDLLDAWARYYASLGLDVEPHQVQVTTGGSEAVMFSFMLTCDPGDNIVVSEPFYTSYTLLATALSINLKPVTADPEHGYCLPARQAIENAIDERSRAIMICSPNNPTGTVLSRDEIATVVQIADERGLFVISDEVYREFCYEGDHTSIWQFPQIGDRTILVDSISKRFSACGARIGALICRNTKVMDAALRLGQSRLCSPMVEQMAAVRLMDLDKSYYEAMIEEYRGRRDLMFDRLQQMPGVFCRKPAGAFYLMTTLPVDDAETFCRWMLTDFSKDGQTVMMAPGAGFYASPDKGTQEARIAYVLEKSELDQAMNILAAALEVYPGRREA